MITELGLTLPTYYYVVGAYRVKAKLLSVTEATEVTEPVVLGLLCCTAQHQKERSSLGCTVHFNPFLVNMPE